MDLSPIFFQSPIVLQGLFYALLTYVSQSTKEKSCLKDFHVLCCLWMSLTVRLPIISGAFTLYYICQKDPKLHISKQFCSRVNLTATIAELRPLALIHCSSMLEQNINRFYTRILAAGYC